MQFDEREREVRAARAAKPPSPEPETDLPPRYMPGSGHILLGAGTPPDPTNDVIE